MKFAIWFSLLNMATLVFAAAPEPQPLRPMTGLWASLKPPDTEQATEKLLELLKGNPHLVGLLIGPKWSEMEPQEGRYDFAALDRCVEIARRAGKRYKLKVTAGMYCPEFIYRNGAARFETVVANPNRSSYGEPAIIPIPWDPVYQRHYSRLIAALGRRYAADPACAAVALTCANYMSGEMHLPKSPEDVQQWAKAGLTGEKLLGVYSKYLDEWAAAFPRQWVCLHMSATTKLPDMSDHEFVGRIVEYAIAQHPGHFALQNNILNGRRETREDPEYPLFKYKDAIANGYQSLASFKTPARQGTIEMAALNFVRMDSEYWELWEGDGMNVETCRKVQAAVEEARKLGYAGYKKKLQAAGKYLRAEDDHWNETMGKMRRQKDAARGGKDAIKAGRKNRAPKDPAAGRE